MREQNEKNNPYSDIINLPHPDSPVHPRMSAHDRAAQFAPFAAVTEHGIRIREKERLTSREIHLEEDIKDELDEKLRQLLKGDKKVPVILSVFEPDSLKEGGSYRKVKAQIVKTDYHNREITLSDGEVIPVERILQIEEEKKILQKTE